MAHELRRYDFRERTNLAYRLRSLAATLNSRTVVVMRTVCQITGGQLFESGDAPTLHAVFRQIDQLQRARLVSAQPQ